MIRDLTRQAETLPLANRSAHSRAASITSGSGKALRLARKSRLNASRNVFESIRLLGVFRFVANFPILGLFFKALQFVMPSFAAKRKAHMDFTRDKIDKRFSRETDRKDFISYASRSHPAHDSISPNPITY